MNKVIRQAIDHSLHGEHGDRYVGCESDLREGLRLPAENSLSFGDTPEQIAAGLDSTDPAAPGMALLYY